MQRVRRFIQAARVVGKAVLRRPDMNQVTKVEIPVEAATAEALADKRRLEAVDRLVRPGGDDPLFALLERSAGEARAAGLTEVDIEAELDAYNAERRT
jgi:hypothetical protein